MFKKALGLSLTIGLWGGFLSFAQDNTERITIVTYYPSPFGVYNQLVTRTLGVGDNNGDGDIDSGDAPDPTTNPNDLWVAGNVGIGTTNPDRGLVVYGIPDLPAGEGGGIHTALFLADNYYGVGIGGYKRNGIPQEYGSIQAWDKGHGHHADLIINQGGGRVGIGTATPQAVLHVNGDIAVSGEITGGDIAEEVSCPDCSAFDVVVVDPETGNFKKSTKKYDYRVAGVISEKPSFIISRKDNSPDKKPLALAGIVECKVNTQGGPIHKGDLLVSSSEPGYAMRANPKKVTIPTQVVGIALGELKKGKGKIRILVK